MIQFYEYINKKLEDNQVYQSNPILQDDMLSWKENIEDEFRNFLHYRSHIAQAKHESEWDNDFYSNLGEDECILVLDFKMKILSSFYREKSKDWFSKRGFSCLGAMIIFGRRRGSDNDENKSENDVLYHMFFSNDTTQDAIYLNTVKE